GSGSVIGRASRAGAIRQPFRSRCQEPAHPTMRIGVVESGRLAGLHQRTAGRQLPDQDRSSVHPSRCGAGTQQALQIHQLLARQFGKSDDVAHTNRVALRTFGLKSNIAILMNKTTSVKFYHPATEAIWVELFIPGPVEGIGEIYALAIATDFDHLRPAVQ